MTLEPILALFDCDGTLVDSQHMIVAAMGTAYARQGLPAPDRLRMLSIVGLSLREAFTDLAEGDAAFPVEEMVEAYRSAFMELRDREPPEPMYPFARDTLDGLRQRDDMLLGMVTGKARRGVTRVLAANAMDGWFSTIQTADDAPSKPHPAMVQQAMAEMGQPSARTVVIGDTGFDMAMAKAAGAHAIGVAWGYHPLEQLTAAGADVIVRDFREIPDAIAALVGGRAPAVA
ncbi:HAD-superfamily hydrolase [Azorhizobium caulinodans ORS 571]|uniref:HAD-superfamily hydrolase n=1 Tax=Azorhizobium caulinodans (strain ATCC 43989 / DSM 5975 / JCM 20966 / LMG 6465 / NBRC 14845 / NCIMB 13405 / ORS 571) TaxID=438753 RepID=A8IAK8_AZOC5|nr:HAD-IA family hydrolase [Azorhizobium caulinodans]BAF88518.1 HAD-superfamily hydrolase [Azorhizobium caulinodans ORS 571]